MQRRLFGPSRQHGFPFSHLQHLGFLLKQSVHLLLLQYGLYDGQSSSEKHFLVSISVSSISTSPGLSLAFVVKRGSKGGGEIVEGISEIPKYPIKFHKIRKS